LIRHVFCAVATAISILPVAVILPPFNAALIASVGRAMLAPPRLRTALLVAIALAPVATGANREQCPTVRITTTP
jgi:hypothetical protein